MALKFLRSLAPCATFCLSIATLFTLSGCGLGTPLNTTLALASFQGSVHGGQAPVVNSHILLYAAGRTGYKSASISRLSGVGYAVSDAKGNFTITALNNCQAGDLVYALAIGGNPGLLPGTDNPSLELMSALGPCSSLTPTTFISINEVTTVAATFALAQFMADPTHVGTPSTNVAGLTSAFATASNLVSRASGLAPALTPGGNGTVPQSQINSLADSLSACVNTDGSGTPCASLFASATPAGGTAPTDTTTAALNIALAPAANVSAIFLLGTGVGAPFQPTLTAAPADWSMAVRYTSNLHQPSGVAVDAQGNVWVSDANSLSKLSPTGDILVANKTGGGMSLPIGVAVDLANYPWTANETNSTISNFTDTGTPLSGTTGFTGGGLNVPIGISIDGGGKIWIANLNGLSVSKFNPDGTPLSGSTGFVGGGTFDTSIPGPVDVAIDGSNFAWILNYDATLTRLNNDGSNPTHLYAPGSNPQHLAIDNGNNIWFTSPGTRSVVKVNSSGATLASWSYTADHINVSPLGIAIDGNGDAWIGAGGATTVNRIVSSTGAVSSYTLPVTLNASAYGLAPDPSGNLWISDKFDNVVVELVGLATPTTTPLSVAIKNGKLATRP